jgi:ketol-acid reductoisomerase
LGLGWKIKSKKAGMNTTSQLQATRIFWADSANPATLANSQVAVIGYGNQGRAQALNLRDSGIAVIIGNREDAFQACAQADGFQVFDIGSAARQADILFLLLPDEDLPGVYQREIAPALQPGKALVFASGYNIAFKLIPVHPQVDHLLIAPRMIGVGVRERYLTGEGFYCLVGVHQDASGRAWERLLALTLGVSGLHKPAIEVTFKQEAILDLFNEQAFGPAFGQVLLNAISVLVENGLPPEAALVEMYLSEEMAYTYQKMAQVGLVRQTLFHSQTSQYGAMSRGVRFLGMGLKKRMQRIYAEIDSGDFAREWQQPIARLKFKAIRFFAMRQKINRLERKVRQSLGMKDLPVTTPPAELEDILSDPTLRAELDSFEDAFEY